MALVINKSDNQVSRQTQRNIRLCFPEFSAEQQGELIRESIFHTCCTFVEAAYIWNQDIEKILKGIEVQNIDPSFYSNTKPRLIVCPHHGSWELMNYWLASQGELYALYKPARNSVINQYIYQKRTRNGATLVATNTAGIRTLLRGLKNGGSCMILPDQRPGKTSASQDSKFFGQAAKTTLLIKNLMSKVDCEIFIGAITRVTATGSYQISIKPLDSIKILSSDQESVDYLNQSIQEFISQHICQYQWSYKRFDDAAYKALD
jgi:Kdo2-lipid IVA lauroyltransferase/acyltransferase